MTKIAGLLPRLSNKPQYVFHPLRALRRALHRVPDDAPAAAPKTARLPWGLPLAVYESDAIGYSILATGVFDPAVTETLHRLIDPGATVVDVGANVGYTASLAAMRAGPGGRVIAYEPHPAVHELLARNVASWGSHQHAAPVETRAKALSDEAGSGALIVVATFHKNMGVAAIDSDEIRALGPYEEVEVPLERLDQELDGESVDVLKIDVEGHEPAVLRGASGLLESGRVRDIVFEDHDDYPDPSTELLERAGYTIIALDNDLLGLRLRPPAERGPVEPWPGPSYLATLDPERAFARLQPRGWQVRGIGPSLPGRRVAAVSGATRRRA